MWNTFLEHFEFSIVLMHEVLLLTISDEILGSFDESQRDPSQQLWR